jgi:hypothetical protein
MSNRFRLSFVSCAIVAALSACSSSPTPLYQQEQFDAAASPYARTFHARSDATCEAARRALLSQGYVSSSPRADTIDGSKNFQPSTDSHVVISFHVVCADANADGTSSTAYVNAVQDRYSLKKTSTSASVGLSVLGSLSLPIGSGDDSMVKVASETIPAGVFYERYFNLVDHFLKIDPARHDRKVAKAAEKEHVAPLPEPAPTPQGEPMKMTTPVVPTPPAPPVPVVPASAPAAASVPAASAPAASTPAVAPAPAPAPAPASAPAAMPAVPATKPEPAPASAPQVTPPSAPASAPAATTTGGES